jgi:hypothetical protein
LALPWQQQLLWLLEAHALPQVDPRASTTLGTGKASTFLLKRENTRFPTEGGKAVTCYSVGGTRRPASPRRSEAQHFPWHQPAGESNLPCLRAGTPAPPLSGNLLLCSCLETCSKGAQRLSTSHWASLQDSPISPVHWMATCYSAGAKMLTPNSAQKPSTLQESPCFLIKD